MEPRSRVLTERRPRYAAYAAMVLAPCIALAAWAWIAAADRGRQDAAGLRAGWRALAEDAGRAALAATLAPVVDAVAAGAGDDAATREARLRALARLPVVADAWAAPPAEAPRAPPQPALAQARQRELVARDAGAALAAYRDALAATGAPAEVLAEAAAGEIACLIRLGRTDEAAAALRAALARERALPVEDAAALALALAEISPPPAGLAATLDAALDAALRRLGAQPLTERVAHAAAAAQRGEDDGRRALLAAALARARAHAQAENAFAADARAWLRGSTAPRWRRVEDRAWYAAAGVVVALDARALRAAVADALARHDGLARLARAYRDRYGRAIDVESTAIAVPTPWAEPLLVDASVAGAPAGGAARWSTEALSAAALAGAIALIGAGLALLARAARREVALGRARADFASTVTHELKTPLALIRMFGEMLALGYARGDGERAEYARIIVDEARRLGLLIGNVLEAAAIERGVRRYAMGAVDVAALAVDVVASHRQRLEAAGFVVAVSGDAAATVAGDRDALTQALLNLLDNAAKYSADEKRIEVAVRAAGGRVALSVADRGVGIAPGDRARLFRPFARGDGVRAPGLGLGLSIVRAIAEAHGGAVAVAGAPGHGSVFTIELPAAGA